LVLVIIKAITENSKILRGKNSWVDKICMLMDYVDDYIPTPKGLIDTPLYNAS